MAGIYPLDSTLTARHALAGLALFAVAFALARTKGALSAKAVRNIGMALCITLSLCFGFTFYASFAPAPLALAAEAIKESLIVVLMAVWVAHLVSYGVYRALLVWGTAAVCHGVLQLVSCWLQHEAHLVFVVVAPLISALCLAASASHARPLPLATDGRPFALAPTPHERPRRMPALTTPVLLIIVLFGLCIALGQMIYLALNVQASMPTSVFAGTFMGIGNCVGGALVAVWAKGLSEARPFSITLVISAVITVVVFYLAPFFQGVATGLFLTVSSAMLQVTGVIPVVFAFLPDFSSHDSRSRLTRYAVASGMNFTGCFVHTSVMVATLESGSNLYDILNAAILITVLLCCFLLMKRELQEWPKVGQAPTGGVSTDRNESAFLPKFDLDPDFNLVSPTKPRRTPAEDTSSQIAPADQPKDPTSSLGETKPKPFHQAIEDLSCEGGLTPQESNVLAQLARGLNARSISDSMTLSSNTVRSHMRSVYAKLDVHSQQELIELVNRRAESVKESMRLTQSG